MKIVILCLITALGLFAFIAPTFEIMLVAVPLFIVGILMLVKGGDVFVDAAANIARAFRIPTFVIGATIVSLATTLPEILVSLFAAAEGSADMAVGNAVGSVTANTALILAISMVATVALCDRKKYLFQQLLLIAATVTLMIGCVGGSLSVAASIVLAVIFVVFMTLNVISGKKEAALTKVDDEASAPPKGDLAINILLFSIGAFALAGGSRFLVNYGTFIARYLGISDLIISLTIIAVGTSLPELVTTITALAKKETNLSVGNIIGANIIDITLILPVCSLIAGKQLPINVRSVYIDIPAMVALTLVAVLPLIFKQKSSRAQGILLLALYALYLVAVVLCEVGVIAL